MPEGVLSYVAASVLLLCCKGTCTTEDAKLGSILCSECEVLWGISFLLNYCTCLLTGSVLCVGSEWHRYPSSFFIPSYISEVRWIDDGFRGLLPFPFNETLGGTSAAPSYFNNKNKASEEQYVCSLISVLNGSRGNFLLVVYWVWPVYNFACSLKTLERVPYWLSLI
jgi:hypothetical protein